jgi:2'-5' RNA ligase
MFCYRSTSRIVNMTAENAAPMVRSFIALPLEPARKSCLAKLQRDLRAEYPGLTPVAPDNLHLTLHFLGDRTAEELAEIGRIMLSVGVKKRLFNVTLEGLGVFPSLRRPRVLWIGLTPQDEVIELHTLLREQLTQAGLLREQQSFRPHLTLGRFKDFRQQAISLGHFLTRGCGSMLVANMVLFGSRLTAQGAIHSPLVTVALTAGKSSAE